MSLGKLLATGRSLAGGPSLGRYNVSERNRLPKFNAAKNPFAQPVPKTVAETAVAPRTIPAPPPAAAPASPVASDAANSPFAPANPEQPQVVRVSTSANWRRLAVGAKGAVNAAVKRMLTRLMAFGAAALAWMKGLAVRMLRIRRKEPRSVFPRFGKPAVQGELSLDNVKVVRNDLEESDLEIVTAQTGTGAQVAPSVPPATPNRGPVPPALKKLTNRMLGVKLS